MGFIPQSAKWYVAEIVEEITVEDDPRNLVHTNMVLVRADSPEEAYEAALKLGAAGEISYDNVDGKRVDIRFRGLHDLNVIHGELEHGAEIIYSEEIGMNESALAKWISTKEDLGVFARRNARDVPDYRSREVVETVRRMMGRRG